MCAPIARAMVVSCICLCEKVEITDDRLQVQDGMMVSVRGQNSATAPILCAVTKQSYPLALICLIDRKSAMSKVPYAVPRLGQSTSSKVSAAMKLDRPTPRIIHEFVGGRVSISGLASHRVTANTGLRVFSDVELG